MRPERWRRLTEIPLAALAVVFAIAYAYEVIANLQEPDDVVPETVMNVVWAAFAIDYVVNLLLARPRKQWFVHHLHELVIVALPVLRPLRLLRLLSLVAMVQRGSLWLFRGRVALYAAVTTVTLVLLAGIAVLDAEQNAAGANIRSIGDAWWWAFTTITTVGYGDFYPVTLAGRLVAVALMVCGVGLLGTVTALIASWFVELVNRTRVEAEVVEAAVDVAEAAVQLATESAGGAKAERGENSR